MQTDEDRLQLPTDSITGSIIRCAFSVQNELGCGFLEKVYENALSLELRANGNQVENQIRVPVIYRGHQVGDYIADVLVEGQVLVEVKAASGLEKAHFAQCQNYLKATKLNVCLLINFGTPRLQYKRVIPKHPFQSDASELKKHQ